MIVPVPPAYSIPKASYQTSSKELLPGPSDYDPYSGSLTKRRNGYSFAKSRRSLHKFVEFPGPGMYSPEKKIGSPGFSINRSPGVVLVILK